MGIERGRYGRENEDRERVESGDDGKKKKKR